MVRPKRNEQKDLSTAIKETAWQEIAENGAAALSLRAIARQLGITAPAIYNYYPRRDDLVTALIVDAYRQFGDAQLASVENLPKADFAGRLRAAGTAYRAWAVQNPQRYQLIFGTPIPGYQAPAEVTTPVAGRALTALVSVLEDARKAGCLAPCPLPELSPALREQLMIWTGMHPVGDVYVLYLAVVIWMRVHGLVSSEISGQYPSFILATEEIYLREIEMMVQSYLFQKPEAVPFGN